MSTKLPPARHRIKITVDGGQGASGNLSGENITIRREVNDEFPTVTFDSVHTSTYDLAQVGDLAEVWMGRPGDIQKLFEGKISRKEKLGRGKVREITWTAYGETRKLDWVKATHSAFWTSQYEAIMQIVKPAVDKGYITTSNISTSLTALVKLDSAVGDQTVFEALRDFCNGNLIDTYIDDSADLHGFSRGSRVSAVTLDQWDESSVQILEHVYVEDDTGIKNKVTIFGSPTMCIPHDQDTDWCDMDGWTESQSGTGYAWSSKWSTNLTTWNPLNVSQSLDPSPVIGSYSIQSYTDQGSPTIMGHYLQLDLDEPIDLTGSNVKWSLMYKMGIRQDLSMDEVHFKESEEHLAVEFRLEDSSGFVRTVKKAFGQGAWAKHVVFMRDPDWEIDDGFNLASVKHARFSVITDSTHKGYSSDLKVDIFYFWGKERMLVYEDTTSISTYGERVLVPDQLVYPKCNTWSSLYLQAKSLIDPLKDPEKSLRSVVCEGDYRFREGDKIYIHSQEVNYSFLVRAVEWKITEDYEYISVLTVSQSPVKEPVKSREDWEVRISEKVKLISRKISGMEERLNGVETGTANLPYDAFPQAVTYKPQSLDWSQYLSQLAAALLGVFGVDYDLTKFADGFWSATSTALAKWADGFFSATSNAWAKFVDNFWTGATALGKFASDFFDWSKIAGVASTFFAALTDRSNWFWGDILGTVSEFWSALSDRTAWNFVSDLAQFTITNLWNRLSDRSNWLWGDILGTVADFWSSLSDRSSWDFVSDIAQFTMSNLFGRLSDRTVFLWGDILGAIADFWGALSDRSSWDFVTDIAAFTIANLFNRLSDRSNFLWGDILGSASDFYTALSDVANFSQWVTQFWGGVKTFTTILSDTASGLFSSLTDRSSWDLVSDIAQFTISNLFGRLTDRSNWLWGDMTSTSWSFAQILQWLSSWSTLGNVSALGKGSFSDILSATASNLFSSISDRSSWDFVNDIAQFTISNLFGRLSDRTIFQWVDLLIAPPKDNLLYNNSFEIDANGDGTPDGWGWGNVSRSSTYAYDGVYSGKIHSDGEWQQMRVIDAYVPEVSEDDILVISFYHRVGSTSLSISPAAICLDSAKQQVGSIQYFGDVTTTTSFQFYSGKLGSLPSGTKFIAVAVFFDPVSSDDLYIDNIRLERQINFLEKIADSLITAGKTAGTFLYDWFKTRQFYVAPWWIREDDGDLRPSGHIWEYKYDRTGGTGGGPSGPKESIGTMKLTTANANGNYEEFISIIGGVAGANWRFSVRIRVSSSYGEFYFGIMEATGSPPSGSWSTHILWEMLRTSGTDTTYTITKNSGSETKVNQSESCPTTFEEFEIVRIGSNVYFYREGVLKETHTTNLPSSGTDLYMFFHAKTVESLSCSITFYQMTLMEGEA